MSLRFVSAIALGGMLVALCSTSRAQQRAGIVVHAWRHAPVDRQSLANAMVPAAALTRTELIEPFEVAVARLDAGALPAERLAGFRRARALMDEGWRAYLSVAVPFAASRLAAARTRAEQLLDVPGGLELYAEITLRLAIVSHHLKRADRAAVLFRLAATLNPTRAVTVAEFVPDAVAARTAALAAKPATVSVRVRARLPRAPRHQSVAIELDGRPLGSEQVTLPIGQHAVVVRAPGYRNRGQVFEVSAATKRVELELDREEEVEAVRRGPASLAIGTREARARLAVAGLLRYAELDRLVIVASVWRRGAPALLGQMCQGLPVRCGHVVELGYARAEDVGSATRELWRLLEASQRTARFPPTLLVDARLVDETAGPKKNGTTIPAPRRWWENPWLWVGAGAAVTAVGAAVLLGRDTQLMPVFDIRPCDFGGCR